MLGQTTTISKDNPQLALSMVSSLSMGFTHWFLR